MHFKIPGSMLIVLILSSLLVACASPIVATELANPTETPQPNPTSTAEPTPTDTPVPLVEPVLPPQPLAGILPASPPNFEAAEVLENLPFDLAAAHAVYAHYRQEVELLHNLPDQEFVQLMQDYYQNTLLPNGIKLL